MSLVEKKVRRDTWQEHEDSLLLETTINFMKEGKSQLLAFEEAAGKLGRTPAACGFRFNSTLREKHKELLSDLKTVKGRRTGKKARIAANIPLESGTKTKEQAPQAPANLLHVTIKDVYEFLDMQQKRIELLEQEVKVLRAENEELRSEPLAGEDYRTMVQLLRRAREAGLSIMEKDGKLTFQMSTLISQEQIG